MCQNITLMTCLFFTSSPLSAIIVGGFHEIQPLPAIIIGKFNEFQPLPAIIDVLPGSNLRRQSEDPAPDPAPDPPPDPDPAPDFV